MNIKNILKKHTAAYLLGVFLLSIFGSSFLPTTSVYANAAAASRYCKTEKKLATNSGEYRNCMAAWLCGYKYYQTPSTKCRNSTKYRYDGHNINLKYWIDKYPNGIVASALSKGKAAGQKAASESSDSTSSGGSGGSSSGGGGATTGSDAPGAGNNGVPEEETSEDGIPDNLGADIIAGQVKLTGSDATNAGIDNRSPDNIIAGILNVVYSVSAVIAVLVIVVAGIMYITSDGDAARVAKAKSAIIYSAVGLVIIGSAFIITGIIQNIGM